MKKYKKPEEEYKKGLTTRESLLISALARQDKKIFSIEDARSVSRKGAGKIMSSLIQKKWVLPLKRGLYAIVPLDVGAKVVKIYRFTLFESDSEELSKFKDDYKYGDGIYWLSDKHPGVIVKIGEA